MAKQERVYMPLPLYHLKQIQYWLVAGIYVLGVEKFSGGNSLEVGITGRFTFLLVGSMVVILGSFFLTKKVVQGFLLITMRALKIQLQVF